MYINEIKITMKQGSRLEKLNLFSHLEDVFESYLEREQIEDFDVLVQMLVQLAVTSEDEEITDAILNAINKATFKDISHIDFNPIAEHMKNFSIRCLCTAIDILSFTHDKNYLPVILEYENHQDYAVRESVHYALMEMGELPIE